MRRVIIESPYGAPSAETIERNVRYARACMADALRRGEAPYASHLLYTQPTVLRDEVPAERELGIEAGLVWGSAAEASAIYLDLGVSRGMEQGIRRAVAEGRPVDLRWLDFAVLVTAIGLTAAHEARAGANTENARALARRVMAEAKSERKAVA